MRNLSSKNKSKSGYFPLSQSPEHHKNEEAELAEMSNTTAFLIKKKQLHEAHEKLKEQKSIYKKFPKKSRREF